MPESFRQWLISKPHKLKKKERGTNLLNLTSMVLSSNKMLNRQLKMISSTLMHQESLPGRNNQTNNLRVWWMIYLMFSVRTLIPILTRTKLQLILWETSLLLVANLLLQPSNKCPQIIRLTSSTASTLSNRMLPHISKLPRKDKASQISSKHSRTCLELIHLLPWWAVLLSLRSSQLLVVSNPCLSSQWEECNNSSSNNRCNRWTKCSTWWQWTLTSLKDHPAKIHSMLSAAHNNSSSSQWWEALVLLPRWCSSNLLSNSNSSLPRIKTTIHSTSCEAIKHLLNNFSANPEKTAFS